MEKKMRIQLYTKEGLPMVDRLISQDIEIRNGPKEVHDGPMRIEFTFTEQTDIQSVKDYLDKLIGTLPLEHKIRKKKKNDTVISIDNREAFLADALLQIGDQDQLIKYLRENEFVFCTTGHLKLVRDLNINFKERHEKKCQWMIRRLKKPAKSPLNDKFDPMLVFGINLLDISDRVYIYVDKEFKEIIHVPIPEKPRETFKKSGMIKFPHYMTPEERDKFRIEFRGLTQNPAKEPSKFFKRWVEYVENLPKLPVKKEEEGSNKE